MKALIIDDESSARLVMKELLRKCSFKFENIILIDTAEEAVNMLDTTYFDFLFLDIQMKGYTGFNLLNQIKTHNWKHLIFVTAYGQYAIKAIKFSASDYLLKPLSVSELEETITRCLNQKFTPPKANVVKEIIEKSAFKEFTLLTHNGYKNFLLKDVLCIEASGNYSIFHFSNREKIMATKTLKYYEDLFQEEDFIRVHKSYITQKDKILKLNKYTLGTLTIESGQEIPISRRKYKALKEMLFNK